MKLGHCQTLFYALLAMAIASVGAPALAQRAVAQDRERQQTQHSEQAQSADRRLSEAEYRADANQLMSLVASQYPLFNPFIDSIAFSGRLFEGAPLPATVGEAAHRFRQVVARLRDGHACVEPSTDVLVRLHVRRALPFNLTWVAGHFVIDAVAPGLPLDSELLAINDIPITKIMMRLTESVCAEGSDPDARLSLAANQFAYLNSISPQFGDGTPLTLRITTAGGEARTLILSWSEDVGGWLLDRQEDTAPAYSARFVSTGRSQRAALNLRVDQQHDIGILTVGSLMDNPELFSSKLGRNFERLQSAAVQHLVIDLRGNSGGRTENATSLLGRLIDQPTALPSSYHLTDMPLGARTQLVLPTRANNRLSAISDTIDGVNRIKQRFGTLKSREPHEVSGFLVPVSGVEPAGDGPKFSGRIILLTDHRTASAARLLAKGLFAALPQRVSHIGPRPLNKLQSGCNRPEFGYVLTNSQLELYLPWLCFSQQPAIKIAGREWLFEPSLSDVHQNRDAALDLAIAKTTEQ